LLLDVFFLYLQSLSYQYPPAIVIPGTAQPLALSKVEGEVEESIRKSATHRVASTMFSPTFHVGSIAPPRPPYTTKIEDPPKAE